MRTLKVAVVVLLGESDYLIHGSSGETAAEVFKSMTNGDNPVWKFDPTTDIAHHVVAEITVPELEKVIDGTITITE